MQEKKKYDIFALTPYDDCDHYTLQTYTNKKWRKIGDEGSSTNQTAVKNKTIKTQ